jgi:uncharacterized membrane protein YcaP (DUF421 family)
MRPDLLIPEISILEKIIRPLVVYVFLLIAFRFFGKRELSSINPFDLIILLTISNVLQNAMIGADNSLTGGLIGGATLFAANALFDRLVFYFPSIGRLAQSRSTVLVENGRILQENLDKEFLSIEDLRHALRKNQVDLDEELPNIRKVLFEPDGAITIVRNIPEFMGLPGRGSRKRR